jgi:hypothetical protein
MKLIEKYRSECYNNNFNCDYLWVGYRKNRSKFATRINQFQDGDRSTSTIPVRDIDHIFKTLEEYTFDNELITKLVIQKANFDVQPQTLKNGCTTRLFFFLKKADDWYLYGHAKGRYNSWKLFNIKKGQKLGYSVYLSISEQAAEISDGLPDTSALARLIARVKQKQFDS